MPTSGRPTQFCEDFLANNGLAHVMQVFQVDYFSADVESEIRQACYSLSLQLIAYVTLTALSTTSVELCMCYNLI